MAVVADEIATWKIGMVDREGTNVATVVDMETIAATMIVTRTGIVDAEESVHVVIRIMIATTVGTVNDVLAIALVIALLIVEAPVVDEVIRMKTRAGIPIDEGAAGNVIAKVGGEEIRIVMNETIAASEVEALVEVEVPVAAVAQNEVEKRRARSVNHERFHDKTRQVHFLRQSGRDLIPAIISYRQHS